MKMKKFSILDISHEFKQKQVEEPIIININKIKITYEDNTIKIITSDENKLKLIVNNIEIKK